MSGPGILAALLLAVFAASWLGTLAVRAYALKRRILDHPNARSSHSVPTPRGGGVAIVAAFLAGVLVLWALGEADAGLALALLLGGAPVAALGFWDDRAPLPARLRLAAHLAAAALVLALLGGLHRLDLGPLVIDLGWLGLPIGVLGLVWLLNLYNFMDGIDGLAASEAVFVAGAGALICAQSGGGLAWVLALLAAASLGFALVNWPPARIFMGDAGSGFLGLAIGTLALAATVRGVTAPWPWVVLLGVFLVDSTLTLVRRAGRGEPLHEAHRSHAYQWAARRFGSHLKVTLGAIAIDLGWLLPWALVAVAWPRWALAATIAALAPLVWLALGLGAGEPEGQVRVPATTRPRPPRPPP
jgi:Fuc2NAc and GlcNAc transferase